MQLCERAPSFNPEALHVRTKQKNNRLVFKGLTTRQIQPQTNKIWYIHHFIMHSVKNKSKSNRTKYVLHVYTQHVCIVPLCIFFIACSFTLFDVSLFHLLPFCSFHFQFEWQIWFKGHTKRDWLYFMGFSLFQLGHDSDRSSVRQVYISPEKCSICILSYNVVRVCQDAWGPCRPVSLKPMEMSQHM